MTDPTRALERLEAAEKAMTPNKWTAFNHYVQAGEGRFDPWIGRTHYADVDAKADAAGIALLRNAAPALIACARALEQMYRNSYCVHTEPGCWHHEASTALASLAASVEGGQ